MLLGTIFRQMTNSLLEEESTQLRVEHRAMAIEKRGSGGLDGFAILWYK